MGTKLELAIEKACRWHAGQIDKAGAPYILHPLSVMFRVRRAGHGEDVQITAVLHDVAEDCDGVDLNDIDHYFGWLICDAVNAITRRKGEAYDNYIKRVSCNPLARIVKLADIDDNLDPERRKGGDFPKFQQLRKRYENARRILNDSA